MIKKRNLDPSLIQWIMTQTGLGPGIGNIEYVAVEESSTSRFGTQLGAMGITNGNISALPSLALDKTTSYRNDIVLVTPGNYVETASLDWDKPYTHMQGIGNANWRHVSDGGGIEINTVTTGIAALVDITAAHCYMGGFQVSNDGADAGNLTPFRVKSQFFTGKQLSLWGHSVSEQAAVEAASSLTIGAGTGSEAYGNGCSFIDCSIGRAGGKTRTATVPTPSGVIYFSTSTQSGNTACAMEFVGCRIIGRAQTAAIPMVKMENAYSCDRYVMFKDTMFYNFWLNKLDNLDYAFWWDHETASGSGTVVLDNCSAFGIDKWHNQSYNHVFASMPITGTGGGVGLQAVGAGGA